MAGWFRREIIEPDRLALLLCFVAFIVTFVTTRVITRLIRAGKGPFGDNVSGSGLHVHHAVPGIILLVSGAFFSVATGSETPWTEIAAVLIGIGTSLVLDEFALILHMSDVYWAEEGRLSVEMVSLAVACQGLLLIGASPISFGDDRTPSAVLATLATAGLFHLGLIVVCVVKGKYACALLGTFIPFLGVICAITLARPDSMWARRFYRGRQLQRAQQRSAWFDRHFGRLRRSAGDFVAGKPTEPTPATETGRA